MIISIACGRFSVLERLFDQKNKYFEIGNRELVRALLFIIKWGETYRESGGVSFDVKDPDWAISAIYREIKVAFGTLKETHIVKGMK